LEAATIHLNQLEIDECIDWIKHCIDFVHDFRYNYAYTKVREFLVFEAQEYYMDVNSLKKIERTTGMNLVHIRSSNGVAELWFSRRRTKIKTREVQQKKNNINLQFNP
jgi:hypothetical protein